MLLGKTVILEVSLEDSWKNKSWVNHDVSWTFWRESSASASKLSSRLSSCNTRNETCNASSAERDTSNTWKQFISDQYFQRFHQINSSILVYLLSQHTHTFHFEWLFELNVLQSHSLVASSTTLWIIWYQCNIHPHWFIWSACWYNW